METTFYHDTSVDRDALKKMKSNMTLDFANGGARSKQDKLGAVLASPDLQMLKLASPELERLIIQQNGMITTTPTPTQFVYPKSVTEEQEAYARGFVDALAELHRGEDRTGPNQGVAAVVAGAAPVTASTTGTASAMVTSDPAPTYTTLATVSSLPSAATLARQPASAAFTTTTTLPLTSTAMDTTTMIPVTTQGLVSQSEIDERSNSPAIVIQPQGRSVAPTNFLPTVAIKEEPQTVPCLDTRSPPIAPIDMEAQEGIKLERKRARNRVAARKCRTRKLERISRLEDRVSELKGQNAELVTSATKLREQVCELKKQIMTHVQSGCQVMLSQNLL